MQDKFRIVKRKGGFGACIIAQEIASGRYCLLINGKGGFMSLADAEKKFDEFTCAE